MESKSGAPVGGLGKLFCETTHNICIKMQQTTVAVIQVNILNDITSKILGEALPWMSPFINIGGTCPSCPIGIDAPVYRPHYRSIHVSFMLLCSYTVAKYSDILWQVFHILTELYTFTEPVPLKYGKNRHKITVDIRIFLQCSFSCASIHGSNQCNRAYNYNMQARIGRLQVG